MNSLDSMDIALLAKKKRVIKQSLWVAYSNDKYMLPIAIADTPAELAEKCGTTFSAVTSSASRAKHKDGFKVLYSHVFWYEDADGNLL